MKISLLTATLALGTLASFAQNKDNRWNLGLSYGTTQYAGDIANSILDFNSKAIENNGIAGLSLSRYLNRSFDLTLGGAYGAIGYYKAAGQFKAEVLDLTAILKYKLANGDIIEENSRLRPYIFIGGGVDRFKPYNTTSPTPNGYSGVVSSGAGLNLMLTDNFALFYQLTYNYILDDKYDNIDRGSLSDSYMIHSLGINFNLGKAKDTDGDGVPDKTDKCPGTPASVKVDKFGCPVDGDGDGVADYLDKCPNVAGLASVGGCPDADKDGVADGEDQCPNEAGLVALNGCPDIDGDGIIDSKDKCPNVKGVLAFEGCPDTDNDGIQDSDDKCPNVAGVKEFAGCPDTDGDGIQDSEDQCIDKKGPAATRGCPDTDNDGVHDGIDRCPTIAGVKENGGCPAVKKEVTQLFQKALQGIQFETGKSTIKKQSNGILDAVVKVMKDNPTYNLSISGHTDDVGNDESNMTLSKDRADAVARYLISKGVDPTRVTTFGYGESRPVDTNKTAAGRYRNRRVELQVEFKQ
jgi:OmpA-OmpF porin, OOP family